MKDNIDNFKGKSALFCLSGSPFQAMCMIEAIHAFQIIDYQVYLCLSKSELPRKEQMTQLLDEHNINYVIESIDFKITKVERLKAFMPKHDKYQLVFIGDCNNELLIFKAFRYASNRATLMYLDDGIASIQFFNGLCQLSKKLKQYYNAICKFRHIDFDRYFYTIYSDLSDKKHISLANDFKHLTALRHKDKAKKGVILLGTCSTDYCRMERIKEEDFLAAQYGIMKKLKDRHPDDEIIFVPHGRDVFPQAEQHCAELGIKFQPTNISVEIYLLEADFCPKAVYGFTSSALFNLRLLLPESEMYNVTFEGNTPSNNRIDVTSDYYAKHGIRRITHQL